MANDGTETWESRLPKNDTIAMKLEPEVAAKIARMAWENNLKTTRQAKLLLLAGLESVEKGGQVPSLPKRKSAKEKLFSGVPKEIVDKVEIAAEKHGRTKQEQINQSLEDGIELQDAIKAVSDFLSLTPPPFSEPDWKPDESECLNFIKTCISEGIQRKERSQKRLAMLINAYRNQEGACAKCGCHIEPEEAVGDFIVPFKDGGTATEDNYRVVCMECSRKTD